MSCAQLALLFGAKTPSTFTAPRAEGPLFVLFLFEVSIQISSKLER